MTDKRVGRPKKTDLTSTKKKGKVGRPAGEAAVIADYKARMLNSPKSRKVLDKIMDAALDDEHKHQAAAWKLMMDRMLPVSMFDAKKGNGAKPAVTINITGMEDSNSVTIDQGQAETIEDGDYEELAE